ncbi:PPE domain-containing protein [Mycobacterium sp. 4D054]|uniref:PPE domain-containing protein n=1 Tax=unclassified Mycobacterium TaxID=2642494 RepID=UPI0021B21366|nr:ESX-1 secretion-associated protein [Mycobacterium sp. SMC-8]UXA13730.1 ESX-1 secretion-associated protein [Mycobacterium sp. SMC-8]
MADELKVDPDDLDSKATMIDGIPWGEDPTAVTVVEPDKLTPTTASVRNLIKNAEALNAEQQWGKTESRRLAETLRLVGQAYRAVDAASAGNIDSTIPGGTSSPPGAPVPIGANATPAPPPPPPMAGFDNVATDGDILDPIETDNKLLEGDQAAALRAAAGQWSANAARLAEASLPFEIRIQNWEGVAAEAAYVKFKSFGGWLQALAGKWTQLAAEAEKLALAHDQAKAANAPIRAQYEALQTQLMTTPMDGGARRAVQLQMEQLYQESEAIRETYARAGQPTPVQPPQPRPDAVAPTAPVTRNGDPRQRGVPAQTEPEERRGTGGGGGQSSSGAGGQQPGGQPQTPQGAPVSPMSAAEQAAPQAGQGSPQGGSQGGSPGGSPGGGSPGGSPGGGSPGGSPGGGSPGVGKGEPKLPIDPSLRPAAAGGGGSGGGGAGGGGGGIPAMPMQPAVGAETVAPTPVLPAAAGPGATGGSGGAAAGAMGGGGMAPMMGGAHGSGSGEKKRNPQLSPDEPLYVEDRPHTEQVIGVRPRRRGAGEDKKGDTQ